MRLEQPPDDMGEGDDVCLVFLVIVSQLQGFIEVSNVTELCFLLRRTFTWYAVSWMPNIFAKVLFLKFESLHCNSLCKTGFGLFFTISILDLNRDSTAVVCGSTQTPAAPEPDARHDVHFFFFWSAHPSWWKISGHFGKM